MSFQEQNKRAKEYENKCINFMNAYHVRKALNISKVRIREGTKKEDCELVADFISEKDSNKECKIALRVLFPYYRTGLNFQQITVRAKSQWGGYDRCNGKFTGSKLELQKIIEGEGDFMITCFVNRDKKVIRYVLICLNALRISGLLSHEKIKENFDAHYNVNGLDKKGFIAIDLDALEKYDCIVYDYKTVYNSEEFWEPLH